ncbi:competence type IV pilus minor pilin ComGG [Bacillus sp. Marseille-P3661]|uniref:competence type IV pilus minor pilin ComGG n=1 Tax=Bacillus sp. Marseille-P3661 TaxID=1936234 RepID=UPI0015E16733|nr:competence type IV pilus minor pilin ComGG [Bacillus sp. Marseille-P3661]
MVPQLNQNGMIYPLAIVFSIIIPFFVLSTIDQYKAELLFLEEQEELLQLQSITQLGLIDIVSILDNTPITTTITGNFIYPNGNIMYSLEMYDIDSVIIQAKAITLKKRQNNIITIIRITDKHIEKWVEG